MMTYRRIGVTSSLVGLLALCVLVTIPKSQPAGAAEHPGQPPSLKDNMKAMNRAYRKLRKQISDPGQNVSSIQLLHTMQQELIKGFGIVPEKTADIPIKQQGKFVLSYKRKMVELLTALLNAEAALLDGDNAAAQQQVGKLNQIKKEGHREFQKDED